MTFVDIGTLYSLAEGPITPWLRRGGEREAVDRLVGWGLAEKHGLLARATITERGRAELAAILRFID